MQIFPVIGIAALAVGFYQISGGGAFEPPAAFAADGTASSVVALDQAAAPKPEATAERIAAVRAAFDGPAPAEARSSPDEPAMVRIRRGSDVEAVRIKRMAPPVRAPMSTPDADAAFERIFEAAARGVVLPTTGAATAVDRTEPVEFTVVEVAAPGAIDAAVDSALDGVLDVREVIGNGVNMRSGPGVQHPVVGQLERGELAEVLREESGWAELRLASGDTAWMAANFLR